MCCAWMECKYERMFDEDVAGKLKLDQLTVPGDVNTHTNSQMSLINDHTEAAN